MVSTPRCAQAFDLDREPDRVRDRYGRNEYGESFLLARRLVEAGVRLVTIIVDVPLPQRRRVERVGQPRRAYGISAAKTGYDLLEVRYCLPPLDRGLSALIEDLIDRGLLDRTLIAAAGEFGRTPKVNKDGGPRPLGRVPVARSSPAAAFAAGRCTARATRARRTRPTTRCRRRTSSRRSTTRSGSIPRAKSATAKTARTASATATGAELVLN